MILYVILLNTINVKLFCWKCLLRYSKLNIIKLNLFIKNTKVSLLLIFDVKMYDKKLTNLWASRNQIFTNNNQYSYFFSLYNIILYYLLYYMNRSKELRFTLYTIFWLNKNKYRATPSFYCSKRLIIMFYLYYILYLKCITYFFGQLLNYKI